MGLLSELGGLGSGSIGRASVDLVLNATKFDAQLAESEAKTKAAGSQMQGGLNGALANIRNGFGATGAAAIGLGAAVAIGISKSVNITQQWAAEVRTLQRVTGSSAESTSALAAAGEVLGLSTEKLNTGFGILDKNIINNSANLTKYGVTLKDANGQALPFDTVLANLSDKFQTLNPGAEQAAFAMNVFGRSGKELIPILARGSAGLAQLTDQAKRAGVIMSDQDLAASKELSIAQRELGEAFKGLAITVAREFIPALTKAVDLGTELVIALRPLFDLLTPLADAIGATADGLGALTGNVDDNAVAVGKAGTGVSDYAGEWAKLKVQIDAGNFTTEEAYAKYQKFIAANDRAAAAVHDTASAVADLGSSVKPAAEGILSLSTTVKQSFDMSQREMDRGFHQMLLTAVRFRHDVFVLEQMHFGLSDRDKQAFLTFLTSEGTAAVDRFVNSSKQKQNEWVAEWETSAQKVHAAIHNAVPPVTTSTVHLNLDATSQGLLDRLLRMG